MKEIRRGIIVVSFERLAHLLELDDEHQVIGVEFDNTFETERIKIKIEGPRVVRKGEYEITSYIPITHLKNMLERK